MKTKKFVMSAVVASSFAVVAFAHGGATGIVKERMDGMSAMGQTMKALAPMMRGEVAYDAEAVRNGAELIGSHAGETLTGLFPEGSGGMPSEAKDAIWEDWEEFSELAEQLHTISEGLALASENGLMMMQEGTADTGSMMGGGSMMSSGSMMGSSAMMGGSPGMMGREELAEMPADGVFAMLSQVCSACHTKYRAEAK